MGFKDELQGLVRMARKKAQDEQVAGSTDAVRALTTVQCYLAGDNVADVQLEAAKQVLQEYVDG